MNPRHTESIQRIPSELAAMKHATDAFVRDVERQGYDPETTFAVTLGFSEALANAFKHGNRRDPAKRITVCYRLHADGAELEVGDEGSGFDPGLIPDALDEEGLERASGRGVLLMRSLFDEVQFQQGGRSVRLVKRVAVPHACAA